MPSNYDAITQYNTRRLGDDTSTRRTQICMYSDTTHFVYEILQNADDYGATEIFFKLSKDRLFIEHNGEPFTEEHVKAITYFGKSISRDDFVKTGHFGVGFKSVFAISATPAIISGDEHFQIYDLYCVCEYPTPDDYTPSRTRIILPFDHDSKKPDYVDDFLSPEEAYTKISSRLVDLLNMNTLLFTKSIRTIRWETVDKQGYYIRKDEIKEGFRWTTTTDGNNVKKHLVFARIPKWKDQQYKSVEIAFAVDDNMQLCATDDHLYVLFATTHETHLQFILNGPYRTNPARETIAEDDQFNIHLMSETCILIKEVLPRIRDMGLLRSQFLSILPNASDRLREFYRPILKAFIDAFKKDDLVPTDDNQYASAMNVLQGPPELRKVITKEELSYLNAGSTFRWAKGVQPNSRADCFLKGLNIEWWGWEQLEDVLKAKYINITDGEDYTWLSNRMDAWLGRLYIMLGEAIDKDYCHESILRRCNIVRVLVGGKESHVTGQKAYFPKGKADSYKTLPQIKRTILRGRNKDIIRNIQKGLELLGVSEIGDEQKIDLLLGFYADDPREITKEQHLEDMREFLALWKKEEDSGKYNGRAIFRSAGYDKGYLPGHECYLDMPLKNTRLNIIYEDKKVEIPKKYKLWSGYSKLKGEGFCEFAIACGVVDGLLIEQRTYDEHPLCKNRKYRLPRDAAVNRDYYISNLKHLLERANRKISLLIWDTVRVSEEFKIRAEYQYNKRHEKVSNGASFILELKEAVWIPDKKGRLRKPCEITREELNKDFKYDNQNRWLDEIGFGENHRRLSEEYQVVDRAAKKIGFDSAEEAQQMARIAGLCRQQGKSPDDFILQLTSDKNEMKPCFPVRKVANLERRSEKLGEQLKCSPEKRYEPRTRLVRITEATEYVRLWLKEQYTNPAGQIVCQICKKEMPFKRQDGEYYYEAVEALPKGHFRVEHEAQFLALCPLCAAMYKELVKKNKGAIADLKNSLISGDELKVPLHLGELETSIQFVETHRHDIRTILMAEK